ncbi:hypothetical protein HHK36_028773 [Tetracentron sinense]|uniref:Uncharacterized protein n=1 Tax=Tetracentron sinense TaxID=13715 RepID=A0A834YDQ3_TETSI|nr:hypothetical protein HHK36_028773 [Tetracentron sinense]
MTTISLPPAARHEYFATHIRFRRNPNPENEKDPKKPGGGSDGGMTMMMRVMVPLRRVVQGRGGLVSGELSGPAYVSTRANSIVKSSDSLYYAGLEKVSEDPYDALSNSDGVIQLLDWLRISCS